MIDDATLLAEFRKNVGNWFVTTNEQRYEIYKSFGYRDGYQWDRKQLDERERLEKSVTIVNLSAPIVRAVSGTEVMQDKKLEFVAMDEGFDQDADDIDKAVSYCQYASGYDSEQSVAREDAATCGIGATVTWLDMSIREAISGRPTCERVFPAFTFFDNSSRGSRLNQRARWCGYADPVSRDDLDERIHRLKAKSKDDLVPSLGGDSDYRSFLLSFIRQENLANIDFVYHYFWYEYEPIIDVMNPFLSEDPNKPSILAQLVQRDNDVANLIGAAAERIGIDWQASWWSLNEDGFKDLKRTIETIGLLSGVKVMKLNSSNREGKCYYKAQIARGMVLSKERSYTQQGFPLNFITGFYDETRSMFYGMMRPLSHVQDALNVSLSDMLDYIKSASHGGNAWITGAGDMFEQIKKFRAHQDDITPLPANAQVTPKSLPDTAQSIIQFVGLLRDLMPRVLGLGEEFLGVISSGDMTDSLYGKVMKQSFAVLANFANNSAGYSKRQGEIFVDIVRVMADAEDGKPLPIMHPELGQKERIFRLRRQNLAREYMTRIVERPMSADERQDAFNKLSQLAPSYQQAGINIMPLISKLAPLDMEDRQQLVQLSTPQPQAPDPVNQALLQSQTRLQNAQAAKLEAEASTSTAVSQSTVDKNNAAALKDFNAAGADTADTSNAEAMDMAMRERVEMSKIASQERMHALALLHGADQSQRDRTHEVNMQAMEQQAPSPDTDSSPPTNP